MIPLFKKGDQGVSHLSSSQGVSMPGCWRVQTASSKLLLQDCSFTVIIVEDRNSKRHEMAEVVRIGVTVQVCCGVERAEPEGKALNLVFIPTFTCGHNLWAVTEPTRLRLPEEVFWACLARRRPQCRTRWIDYISHLKLGKTSASSWRSWGKCQGRGWPSPPY